MKKNKIVNYIIIFAVSFFAVMLLLQQLPSTASKAKNKNTPQNTTSHSTQSNDGNAKLHWVGTWATSPMLTKKNNMPPKPGLSNNTLRQVVHVSIGGSQLRLKFSNEYGNSPLVMKSVHLALSSGSSSINTSSDKTLLFKGKKTVTIPAGKTVTSDVFTFDLPKLTNVAVTIYFGSVPTKLTGHAGSRTTSFIITGNNVISNNMSSAVTTEHWYVITGIEVFEKDSYKAIAALGDSITDGRGSTTNGNDRWTDNLAAYLQKNPETSTVSIVNYGIGGNCVLSGGLGTPAVKRFDRDIFGQNGVRYLIILEGVNDIGNGKGTAVAEKLINAYKEFIRKAHAKNLLVYGATILPFGGSEYDSAIHEKARSAVNKWIRTSGQFDAVIDLDAALRDENNETKLLKTYDCGDHLHPNPTGYKKIADVIDLNLFTE